MGHPEDERQQGRSLGYIRARESGAGWDSWFCHGTLEQHDYLPGSYVLFREKNVFLSQQFRHRDSVKSERKGSLQQVSQGRRQVAKNMLTCKSRGSRQSRVQDVGMFSVRHAEPVTG